MPDSTASTLSDRAAEIEAGLIRQGLPPVMNRRTLATAIDTPPETIASEESRARSEGRPSRYPPHFKIGVNVRYRRDLLALWIAQHSGGGVTPRAEESREDPPHDAATTQ